MSTPDPAGTLAAARPASLEERVDAALDVCDDVLTVLPALAERLERLERTRAATAGERRSDFRFESYPTPKTAKAAADQRARCDAAWARLTDWVDWLVATYRLTSVVPPCWPEHPAVREELVSLRVAWVGAWADNAAPDAPSAWQDRLFKARARLADGNWGRPRCDGDHDGSGLDTPEQYRQWTGHPARDTALATVRDRTRAALPAPAAGGDL
ncbi:hypothetical protein F0L68_40995 [Solihabitans fulvus]|uniref:Uncharacterized protein n=1 Tax=Solihabitans fulvus TaxID=1892852 RepID=A0A5B2W2V9_9PSEU|nr:hypothetical protein [Solihabitans fulvus]KAA2245941.1 hypothetical protein F0L68_40995 [Solihabitans fulvus]